MTEPASDPFSSYAFIGLGANLPSMHGSARETLNLAIDKLRALSNEALLVSPLLETAPLDCPPGSPDFINAVVGLVPLDDETPFSLLGKLQALENSTGRTRSGVRNEARVLDLDLLTFQYQKIKTDILVLPHPRAHIRRFVLEPLKGLLGGDTVFPYSDTTLAELLQEAD